MSQKATMDPAPRFGGLAAEQVEAIDAARSRRVERRELAAESVTAGAFVLAAVAFWMSAGSPAPGLTALSLVLVCAALLRIKFEVGEGVTNPVVLAIVPMLLLLPPATVPLVFAAGQLAARLPDVVTGRVPAYRMVFGLGDSWFALAPALVVAATGVHPAALVIALAVAAQMAADFAISALRLWAAVGVGPHWREYAWVYGVDVLLTPVALLVAVTAQDEPFAVFAVLPLAALIAVFAHERKGRVENALALQRMTEHSRARLQSIVQHSSDLIVILETDGALRTVTGSVAPIFGAETGDHGSLLDRVHPDDIVRVSDFLAYVTSRPHGDSAESEWRMRYDDGSYRHIGAVATNLLADGVVNGLVLTARDVEARKLREEQLRHRAFHDELTGLANRALFFDRVEHALLRGSREDAQVAVVFIDLDDFKGINDRLGHAAGDKVLREVAERFGGSARSADTVARLGGDEFGVLLEGVPGPRAVQAAERLLEALRAPVRVDGEELRISASAGLALGGADARDVEELLRKGDLAMYAAKRNGKRRLELFDPAMTSPEGRRPLTWFMRGDEQRDEIRALLEDPDGLTMVFQPIMDLRTGRIAGYEALSRFNRTPYRSPDQWFAQAHRCGLGYAVEAKALAAALAMPGRPEGTYLAVNLSPSSLTASEIQAALPERLDDLVIEVTENELASGDPAVAEAIAALRERGARLAVDDVGSGYAGLTHVMRLAPDVIKLDRALTTGIEGDPVKAALVSSFVRYARDIDATVCSEGIETHEELMQLAALDVSYGQGYLIARPAAPWAEIDPDAAEACGVAFRAALHEPTATERFADLVARAASPEELDPSLPAIAAEIGADEVRIALDGPARAGQLLAGDPGADPARVAALLDAGFRAELTLPIGAAGRLQAFSRAERPWTRLHISRARFVAAMLERLSEGDRSYR
jgi:diguanylate cyclase (GGDEF)-like protein/PAS domain S-box-containing protein